MLLRKEVTMIIKLLFQRLFLSTLVVGSALFLLSGTIFAENGSTENDEGMEVLTRGPIHEAFADVSVDQAPSGPVISRPAPEPINEIPPEVRPEGNQIEWISGYWSWDEDQNDFIWVSGVWRDVPPNRQWTPGYWQTVDGGHRYISGYWTDSNQTPTEYLPPPPQPLQAGASSPPPTADYVWMDGNWIWSQNGYAWQTGYWYEPRPDMVWVPAHYVWTPRGYIFVMGYFDYFPGRRGVMYAPLYYPRPIYRHHRYFYQPHVVLDTDAVFLSLFVRPGFHHYYFGNYHDNRYEKRGFRPWYSKRATRYGYDPFYRNYRSHRMRDNRQWENNYHRQFKSRRDHREARPPQRFEPTRERQFSRPQNPTSKRIGKLFSDTVEKSNQSEQFIRVKPDRQREIQTQSRKDTNFQAERRKLEKARHTQEPTRQPAGLKKSEKTRPLFVPGQSKEERQEVADRQNQQLENQRFQQQQDRNNNEMQGRPLWQKRSNQQGYSK